MKRKENRLYKKYHYRGIGLDNVYITNVPCTVDAEGCETISISNPYTIMSYVAHKLVQKQGPLEGKEIYYLRSFVKQTQEDLAASVEVTRKTIINWEKNGILNNKHSEIILRLHFGDCLKNIFNNYFHDVLSKTATLQDVFNMVGHAASSSHDVIIEYKDIESLDKSLLSLCA